jgi:hypothetical protein
MRMLNLIGENGWSEQKRIFNLIGENGWSEQKRILNLIGENVRVLSNKEKSVTLAFGLLREYFYKFAFAPILVESKYCTSHVLAHFRQAAISYHDKNR